MFILGSFFLLFFHWIYLPASQVHDICFLFHSAEVMNDWNWILRYNYCHPWLQLPWALKTWDRFIFFYLDRSTTYHIVHIKLVISIEPFHIFQEFSLIDVLVIFFVVIIELLHRITTVHDIQSKSEHYTWTAELIYFLYYISFHLFILIFFNDHISEFLYWLVQ